jgi:ABC-type antimicrobial peptide transport system permease subunit
MAYSIQQRTREIAVRMALGAEPWTVRGMVLMEGLRLTLTGVALGAAGAMALSRSMVSLIYGVRTWDPIVFAAVTALLCGVAIAAILLSARAATAIEPTEALRRA